EFTILLCDGFETEVAAGAWGVASIDDERVVQPVAAGAVAGLGIIELDVLLCFCNEQHTVPTIGGVEDGVNNVAMVIGRVDNALRRTGDIDLLKLLGPDSIGIGIEQPG